MHDDATPPAGRNPSLERRLATIMMADVHGYSRMVGENEERTIEILRGHRQIFDELLAQHRGRVFNTAGDAILAEFPSAVDAVRCATEIQTALRTRNDHLPEDQRMWFRIGINLGDVIVQGGDLLGDGVNVAARIQTVSEPGGICLSGSVYDQIQNKLSLHFRQLGERNFKNIAQPVRTFSIVDIDGAAPRAMGAGQFRKRALASAAAAIVVVALGAGYWQYQVREARLAEAALAVEANLKAEREKAAAATAQHEAKLLAELQASKDALAQAEASKRKAEQDRIAAETAQREARLQSELRAAKDAQLRAEASEKKAEDERKVAAAEALRAAAAKAAEAKAAEARTSAKAAPSVAEPAARTTAAVAGKGVERFDGAYLGRMCTTRTDGSPRCWKVALQVQKGALSGSWIGQYSSSPSRTTGTIAPDGSVTMTADGYKPNGDPLAGKLSGSWADNAISVTGNWSNGFPLTANWTRAH
jgi:class 3 adenylate cyclase